MHMTLQQALPHLSARPDVLVSTDMAADERTSDIPSLWKHTTGGERALKEAGEPQVAARLPQRMKAEATLRYQHEEMVNAIRDLLECVGPLEGHNSTSDLWNMAGRIALQQRLKEHAPTVEAYVRIVEEVTRLATTLLCKSTEMSVLTFSGGWTPHVGRALIKGRTRRESRGLSRRRWPFLNPLSISTYAAGPSSPRPTVPTIAPGRRVWPSGG